MVTRQSPPTASSPTRPASLLINRTYIDSLDFMRHLLAAHVSYVYTGLYVLKASELDRIKFHQREQSQMFTWKVQYTLIILFWFSTCIFNFITIVKGKHVRCRHTCKWDGSVENHCLRSWIADNVISPFTRLNQSHVNLSNVRQFKCERSASLDDITT